MGRTDHDPHRRLGNDCSVQQPQFALALAPDRESLLSARRLVHRRTAHQQRRPPRRYPRRHRRDLPTSAVTAWNYPEPGRAAAESVLQERLSVRMTRPVCGRCAAGTGSRAGNRRRRGSRLGLEGPLRYGVASSAPPPGPRDWRPAPEQRLTTPCGAPRRLRSISFTCTADPTMLAASDLG
jgi:hypothetical protein